MRLIEIYDNGGFRSACDDQTARRLRSLTAFMPVGTIRRGGRAADMLKDVNDLTLYCSDFGFMSRFTLPSSIRRLAGDPCPLAIHVHSLEMADMAAMSARLLPNHKVKIVLELSSSVFDLLTPRQRTGLASVDALIFHTATDRDRFLADHTEVSSKAIVIIPPSVAPLEPTEIPKEPTLLWGGRITRNSGLGELIEKIAETPDYRLLVAAQGQARHAVPLIKLVRKLGLNSQVEFLGDIAIDCELMAKASALVVTSEADPFASWHVAIARAVGRPVVTSPAAVLGADAEVGNQLPAPAGDPGAALAALVDFYYSLFLHS